MSGFDQQVVASASMSRIGDTEIRVASAEHLVVMKQLAGRPRDIEDILGILIRQGLIFNWPLAQRLASELSEAVEDDLLTPLQNVKSKLGL